MDNLLTQHSQQRVCCVWSQGPRQGASSPRGEQRPCWLSMVAWQLVSGPCAISSDGDCISDGSGNYGNNNHCVFRPTQALQATIKYLDFERCCDRLRIDNVPADTGVRYQLGTSSEVVWSTDGSINGGGFVMCTGGAHGPSSWYESSRTYEDNYYESPLAMHWFFFPGLLMLLSISCIIYGQHRKRRRQAALVAIAPGPHSRTSAFRAASGIECGAVAASTASQRVTVVPAAGVPVAMAVAVNSNGAHPCDACQTNTPHALPCTRQHNQHQGDWHLRPETHVT